MLLDDPFAIALPVIHGSAGSTAARYWQPGSLSGADIRIIRSRKSEDLILNEAVVTTETEFAHIMRADVERPMNGARLEIVDEKTGVVLERFTIAAVPRSDIEATSWACQLRPS